MEKVRPWCGQPSDCGRLKNRTVRDYPGRPVPEETFIHSHPFWSSDILYQLPPSTTIHSILLVQFTCLTVLSHNKSRSCKQKLKKKTVMSTDGWCSGKSSIQPVKNPGFLESQVSARTMNDIITIISANLNTHSHVHTHEPRITAISEANLTR